MLWPSLSVAAASPWQVRQSAWARRARGARATARIAMAAERIRLRELDRACFCAARFILPSSFPRQKRIDPRLYLVSYIQARCGWGKDWPQRPRFRIALFEATLAVIGVTSGAM
jgi:hypothetical protein